MIKVIKKSFDKNDNLFVINVYKTREDFIDADESVYYNNIELILPKNGKITISSKEQNFYYEIIEE